MNGLYDAIQRKKVEEWGFHAAIHGIDYGKVAERAKNSPNSPVVSQKDINPNVPLFGDPQAYQSIPLEEREQLTKNMMAKHQTWSQNPFSKG